MTAPETMDDAIRALARQAALVAVEQCVELTRTPRGEAGLLDMREQIADEVAELLMETADECADHEVHAVRAFGGSR
jgi:hypothetical protein